MGTTASKACISGWFDRGLALGATHLIVVCDGFDHDDYPVFAHGDQDALERHDAFDGKNMQRVMEVYDLREDKDRQMALRRAMNLPRRPGAR